MGKTVRSPLSSTTSKRSDSDSSQALKEEKKAAAAEKKATDRRKKLQMESASDKVEAESIDTFDSLRLEMREMFEKFQADHISRMEAMEHHILSNLNLQISNVQETNLDIVKSVDLISDKLTSVQNTISRLETERKVMSTEISALQTACENLELNLRKTSIEIRNVPKRPKENKTNLLESFGKLAQIVNVNISTSDVRDIYRLNTRQTEDRSTIVVEMSNVFVKEKFLSEIRRYNKSHMPNQLNATHLGINVANTFIYISDHLTPKTKRLHFVARDFAKSQDYQYCWTSQGKVYLRKKDGQPYIRVSSEEQLKQLLKKD